MSGDPFKRKRVAVFPGSRCASERRLLASLAELYPVQFVREEDLSEERMDGAVFFPEAWDQSQRVFELGVPVFRFACHARSISLGGGECVSFSDSTTLHVAFRGAQVPLGGETSVARQTPGERDIVLACHGSTPLWRFRAEAGVELHTSAFAAPALKGDELLWRYLRPANWADLLPLLHFLRHLTAHTGWRAAPPRGCFMFDDPNLHSVRYGHIDFREFAQESRIHSYHAAFATVPLDSWYAAREAVGLFLANRERLSLLIHGNDHTQNELGGEYSRDDGLRILAQALTRVDRLERRTGLRVARVIAPRTGVARIRLCRRFCAFPSKGSAPQWGRWCHVTMGAVCRWTSACRRLGSWLVGVP